MIEHAFSVLYSTLSLSNFFISVALVKSSEERGRGSTSKSQSQDTKPSGHPHVSGGSRVSCITPEYSPLPFSVPSHSTAMNRAQISSFSRRLAVPCLVLAAPQNSSRSGPPSAQSLPLSCQPSDRRQRWVSRQDAFQSKRTLVLSLCNSLPPRRLAKKAFKINLHNWIFNSL